MWFLWFFFYKNTLFKGSLDFIESVVRLYDVGRTRDLEEDQENGEEDEEEDEDPNGFSDDMQDDNDDDDDEDCKLLLTRFFKQLSFFYNTSCPSISHSDI